MPLLKLSDAAVASFRPTSDDVWLWDTQLSGFACRIRDLKKGTSRAWYIAWQFGGKGQKMWLGDIPGMPCKTAREEAGRHLSRARLGDNPLAAKREEAARIKAQVRFGEPIEPFLTYQKNEKGNRPGSLANQRRHLTKYCREWHKVPLDEIDGAKVKALRDRIRQEVGLPTAIVLVSSISAFFTWCMEEGLAKANPVIGIRKMPLPESRDRVLDADEIVEVWDAASVDDSIGNKIIKLLLLLGLRRNEVANADWSEFDLDKALWVIPAERMKAKMEHRVPLSAQALALLPERPEKGGPVFGLFSSFSFTKAELDRQIAKARKAAGVTKPMTPWRIHDLRRSMATHMGETLGILPHVIEECLSHRSYRSGVASVYNRSTYEPQKRQALTKWGDYIEALADGTVVEMKRSA
ncbi:tyrosine-type recombinase/integrase [Mesorhizobium muleiense]|uniref:Site-specific recombinase XerD n=1 Tax=Mesorhizobium muleiense TaxID=1004279 RepID=A0A1G8LDQ9_9HYPH|nr:site-specific integrase [Mesorhizobium muleiense]MCF6100349.1 tyrosine-type recombinase/integrase [Mesorhizobium muleiense]SDI53766.1 Site-specific recombinase XerD [Mesorhizobium muleiense]